MLDLSGLFLNRNPIAKVQIILEISKSCPKVCADFFHVFPKNKNTPHSGAILCLPFRSVVSPLQVRCKSVL